MPRPLPADVLASTGGDIDAIRAHILDAALRAIRSHGLAAASTRVIAAEAGIAAGTLYNYFDDRLQLIAQTMLRRAQVLSQPVADLALRAGKRTVASNLRYVARHAGSVLDELVPLIGAAFSDTDLLNALRREMATTDTSSSPVHLLERYLLAERELGRISPEADCLAAASMVVGVCHDRAFHRYLRGDTGKPDSIAREIEFVARALTPPTGRDARRANPAVQGKGRKNVHP